MSTVNIKKAFQPIMSLLAANMDATVGDIYTQAESLCAAKSGGGGQAAAVYVKNDAGEDVLVGLHCSYHGLFFKPEEMPFGEKKSSASGFNTMSKDGLAKWTKQLGEFKKAKAEIVDKLKAGELELSDVDEYEATLEEKRQEIVPMEGVIGYETAEELIASL